MLPLISVVSDFLLIATFLLLITVIKCPAWDACLHMVEILALGSAGYALSLAYNSAIAMQISFKFGMCIQ